MWILELMLEFLPDFLDIGGAVRTYRTEEADAHRRLEAFYRATLERRDLVGSHVGSSHVSSRSWSG
jgi:hypothetical protein